VEERGALYAEGLFCYAETHCASSAERESACAVAVVTWLRAARRVKRVRRASRRMAGSIGVSPYRMPRRIPPRTSIMI
jgi:hypothetical protein